MRVGPAGGSGDEGDHAAGPDPPAGRTSASPERAKSAAMTITDRLHPSRRCWTVQAACQLTP